MSQQPWYAGGLRFRCTGCGACCTGAPGHVWVNQSEIEALAALVELDVERFESRYVRRVGIRRSLAELHGGDCVFFDPATRRCTVYARRPRQCRTWPFWPSNLRSPAAWAEMASHCPGANCGRLIPLARIEQRAGVVRV